jgi:hypothetical protein
VYFEVGTTGDRAARSWVEGEDEVEEGREGAVLGAVGLRRLLGLLSCLRVEERKEERRDIRHGEEGCKRFVNGRWSSRLAGATR